MRRFDNSGPLAPTPLEERVVLSHVAPLARHPRTSRRPPWRRRP